MPIADLALAALLAFAAAEAIRRAGRRGTAVAAALLVLVALDLGAEPVSATAADPDNAAYAALSGPGGFSTSRSSTRDPLRSVYDYYALQARSERPQGYNTLGSKARLRLRVHLQPHLLRNLAPGRRGHARAARVCSILLHRGRLRAGSRPLRLVRVDGLEEAGWAPTAQGGAVTLFARGSSSAPPPLRRSPSRAEPVFCQGWRDGTTTELQAPLLALRRQATTSSRFTADSPSRRELSVEGHVAYDELVTAASVANLDFERTAGTRSSSRRPAPGSARLLG